MPARSIVQPWGREIPYCRDIISDSFLVLDRTFIHTSKKNLASYSIPTRLSNLGERHLIKAHQTSVHLPGQAEGHPKREFTDDLQGKILDQVLGTQVLDQAVERFRLQREVPEHVLST